VALSVVGRKGSGKSEVLEALIRTLHARGLRVGVIKYLARDDFEIDQPGKDTYRYRFQGAEKVMLAGRKRLALFSNLKEETPLADLLAFFSDFDWVFLEGFFQDEIPKLEIHRKELGRGLLAEGMKNVLAVCSDDPDSLGDVARFGMRVFSSGDIQGLAAYIETELRDSGIWEKVERS
jgi:molybdopterin-guanine dinucleotide biosynthesis protein MobB